MLAAAGAVGLSSVWAFMPETGCLGYEAGDMGDRGTLSRAASPARRAGHVEYTQRERAHHGEAPGDAHLSVTIVASAL
jgi:hypothetical protein